MGRSFWLEGDLESSLGWLERATRISPNYAQGIYARAWTEALGGRPAEARTHVDLAMRLSPIDPLYYAMMATRAFTHMVKGEDKDAADWAERGARAPGAHVLIAMIAAAAQSLGGNLERARWWAANVRERNGAKADADFFRAFPMKFGFHTNPSDASSHASWFLNRDKNARECRGGPGESGYRRAPAAPAARCAAADGAATIYRRNRPPGRGTMTDDDFRLLIERGDANGMRRALEADAGLANRTVR